MFELEPSLFGILLSLADFDTILIDYIKIDLHIDWRWNWNGLSNCHVMSRALRDPLHGPINLLVIFIFDHDALQALRFDIAVKSFDDLA